MSVSPLWAVVVALPHEAKALLPQLKIQAQTAFHSSKLYEGLFKNRRVLLLQTGMGAKNASRSMEFLLAHHPITHCLVTGYCGGLVPGLKTGHGILAAQVFSQENPQKNLAPNFSDRENLLQSLSDQGVECQAGALVEVPRPVLEKKDKQALQAQFGAIGVDMESFSVLSGLKSAEKITSLLLRFVVDPLDENLVDTEAFIDADSSVRPWKLLQETIRNPKLIIDLPQLDRLARMARRQMTKALEWILTAEEVNGV